MKVIAKLKYLRISPRKVRLVANLVSGLDVGKAEEQLSFFPKHAALPLRKLLRSAIANAEHNFNFKRESLYVRSLIVEGGPILKRFLPRMGGRASDIKKRTSHVILTLERRDEGGSRKRKTGREVPREALEKIVVPARGTSLEAPMVSTAHEEGIATDIKTRKEKLRAPKQEKIFQKTPRFMKRIFRRKSV